MNAPEYQVPSFQNIFDEIADNWPAFVYILLTLGFSICFLRERRRETRLLRDMGERMNEGIRVRFDRMERLLQEQASTSAAAKSEK